VSPDVSIPNVHAALEEAATATAAATAKTEPWREAPI
jgi:hypothetical protein